MHPPIISAESQVHRSLQALLRRCDETIATITPESTTEAELLQLLRTEIAAATREADPLQAELLAAMPKPLDDPRLQQVFGDCIDGALTVGFQGSKPPPEGHWLWRFWSKGRAAAEALHNAGHQSVRLAAPPEAL